jgi:hypothetical protein
MSRGGRRAPGGMDGGADPCHGAPEDGLRHGGADDGPRQGGADDGPCQAGGVDAACHEPSGGRVAASPASRDAPGSGTGTSITPATSLAKPNHPWPSRWCEAAPEPTMPGT